MPRCAEKVRLVRTRRTVQDGHDCIPDTYCVVRRPGLNDPTADYSPRKTSISSMVSLEILNRSRFLGGPGREARAFFTLHHLNGVTISVRRATNKQHFDFDSPF